MDLGSDVYAVLFTRDGWKCQPIGAVIEVPAAMECLRSGDAATTGTPRGRCALKVTWTPGELFELNALDPLDISPLLVCPCGGVCGAVREGVWTWA